MKTRVILIGIGGASCSGKTSLATKLRSVIPGCSILHQDDFWTKSENLPIHPKYSIPDAEDAAGAIEWPRFRAAVAQLKASPSSSGSTLNSGNSELDNSSSSFSFLSDRVVSEWREYFQQAEKEWLDREVKIEWKIVEGFVLFYDSYIVQNLDVQIFIRSLGHVLRQRRLDRSYACPGSLIITTCHVTELRGCG
ncbi:hypothetical protein BDV93DRAFT_266010 [Ceratobasidium sp. AG-I]|nr:hypothetical protein BDV93DRAFT_266010 [Ceratobasidium sp. AG-I]